MVEPLGGRPLWLPSARDLHETELMTDSRVPSASEVLDLMDALQRSETERPVLQTSWGIFQAAAKQGIVRAQGIDAFALRLQELHDDGLIAFRSQSAGVVQRGYGTVRRSKRSTTGA